MMEPLLINICNHIFTDGKTIVILRTFTVLIRYCRSTVLVHWGL